MYKLPQRLRQTNMLNPFYTAGSSPGSVSSQQSAFRELPERANLMSSIGRGVGRRTIVWDTVDCEVLAELPQSGNWNFAALWSPRTPGVFVTAGFDGKVSVYALETCEQPDAIAAGGGGDFAALLSTSSSTGACC